MAIEVLSLQELTGQVALHRQVEGLLESHFRHQRVILPLAQRLSHDALPSGESFGRGFHTMLPPGQNHLAEVFSFRFSVFQLGGG